MQVCRVNDYKFWILISDRKMQESYMRNLGGVLLDFRSVESQAVGDYGYAAHSHGECGQDGVQLSEGGGQEVQRIKQACGDWNENDIIDKGPEEVLFYGSHGSSTQLDGPEYSEEVPTG